MMFVKEKQDYNQFNESNQKLEKEKGKVFTVYHLLRRFSGIMPSLLSMSIWFRPIKIKSKRLTQFHGKLIF